MTDRQILNIAAELSRANKWFQEGNQPLVTSSLERALDLIDSTVDTLQGEKYGLLRELLRLREVLCAYYAGQAEDTLSSALKNLLDLKVGTHELHLELA